MSKAVYVHGYCCVPYLMSHERAESVHALNCPRFCSDAQHQAIIDRLLQDDNPLAMYGIRYPRCEGDVLLIHDPNVRELHPERTYTYIAADGTMTFSSKEL